MISDSNASVEKTVFLFLERYKFYVSISLLYLPLRVYVTLIRERTG